MRLRIAVRTYRVRSQTAEYRKSPDRHQGAFWRTWWILLQNRQFEPACNPEACAAEPISFRTPNLIGMESRLDEMSKLRLKDGD